MPIIIDMPKLSDTMTVGTLVRWLKNEGDSLKSGDMIAEVETDKATMELENFEEGILLKRYVGEGSQVAVGTPICAVGKAGEVAPDAPGGAPKAAPQSPMPAAQVTAVADSEGSEGCSLITDNGRIKASPLAKKVASQAQVDLRAVQGTGPGGRIVKADVLMAAQAPVAKAVKEPVCMQSAACDEADVLLPVSGMRATIARRLLESKTQIPHFYVNIAFDPEPLGVLRAKLNAQIEAHGGVKLTINDFILRAVAIALKRVPAVNASWEGQSIRQHGSVHVAFGVALEDGLVTPVIRNAHAKTLGQISQEAKAYIAKSKAKKLTPAEMSGSTFTVTNMGMLGVHQFYGIINPPNAGILAVGSLVKKPVINPQGQIVAGERMFLNFSGDHRVIDGAVAASFLTTLKDLLQHPEFLLL